MKVTHLGAIALAATVLLGAAAILPISPLRLGAIGRRVDPEIVAQQSNVVSSSGLVAANTRFGFRLFSEIVQEEEPSNLMISPSSVAIALAMTYNGASGDTQQAMADALELQGMSLEELNRANSALMTVLENADPEVKIAIANSIWAREGTPFNADFLQRNQESYQAEVSALDFGNPNAPDRINDWVSRQTERKIPQIIDRIDADSVMFLINAIYFKGSWSEPFEARETRDRPFTLLDGTQKQHPMMSQTGNYRYLENDQFQAISLPYGTGRLSMVVFLPREQANLTEFLRSLTPENWQTWTGQLASRDGSIQLPKFKLEYGIRLNDALKALGMEIAFDPNRATFAELSPEPMFIDRVQHKTFIEVNEEGTEAAAVTSVTIAPTSVQIPTEPFQMVVDRPFFYAIQDNQTGAVLFMGTVVNPS